MDFELRSVGKWILAGEHAVLRGCPALVFPLKSGFYRLKYTQGLQPLSLRFAGPNARDLRVIFWGALEVALDRVGQSRADLKGEMEIDCHLPVGCGLGASAALSVLVARWWERWGWIRGEEIQEFARQLENLFHGESSGVDVAASLSESGIRFVKGERPQALEIKWLPQWFLSYSGHRGVTAECVSQVKALFARAPDLGEKIDREMWEAVQLCQEALCMDPTEGLWKLARGMDLARNCFQQWGLTEGALEKHMNELVAQGALAVKPTGSGGGGYVLSLWKTPPKEPQALGLIGVNGKG